MSVVQIFDLYFSLVCNVTIKENAKDVSDFLSLKAGPAVSQSSAPGNAPLKQFSHLRNKS